MKTDIRDPYLLPDATTLFYADDASGVNRIYQSNVTAGTYATGTALTELETAQGEYRSVVSADLHTIYWNSTRTDLSPRGMLDIYMATRTGTSGSFGSVRNVSELNSSANDCPKWILPDNCRLYFQRDDGMYVASWAP